MKLLALFRFLRYRGRKLEPRPLTSDVPRCVMQQLELVEGVSSDLVEAHPLLEGFRPKIREIRTRTTTLRHLYEKPLEPEDYQAAVSETIQTLTAHWRHLSATLAFTPDTWRNTTDMALQKTSTTHKNQNVASKPTLRRAFLSRMQKFYQREKEFADALTKAVREEKSVRVLSLTIQEQLLGLNGQLPAVPQVQASLGKLREADIQIQVKSHFLFVVPGAKVQTELGVFLSWLATQLKERRHHLSDLELAARSYQTLLSIHPFNDGNGRTAVALMQFLLTHRGNFPRLLMRPPDTRLIRFSPVTPGTSIAGAANASPASQMSCEDALYVFAGAMYRSLRAIASLYRPRAPLLPGIPRDELKSRPEFDRQDQQQQSPPARPTSPTGLSHLLHSKLKLQRERRASVCGTGDEWEGTTGDLPLFCGEPLRTLEELAANGNSYKAEVEGRSTEPRAEDITAEEYEARMRKRLAEFRCRRNSAPDIHRE
eukprot:g30236.t1